MCRIIMALLAVGLLGGCGSSSGDPDISQPGLDLGREDGVESDGVEPVDSGADESTGPAPISAVAFRLETRFGTTLGWKGLAALTPMAVVHSETDAGGACEKDANPVFLQQFVEVVNTVDPFSWQADYTNSQHGACASDTFTMILTIQRMSDGKEHQVRWCDKDADTIPGMSDFMKKVEKLKADANQNGTCGLLPFVLGKPTAVAHKGSDDGLQHLVSVARFDNPNFCIVMYTSYSLEVYQSTYVLSSEPAFVDELLSLYFPSQGQDETIPGLLDVCPEAAPLLRDGSFVTDLEPMAAVFLVDRSNQQPRYFMATSGIATVEPLIQEGEPLVFQLNGTEFRPLEEVATAPTLDRSPWFFHYIDSTSWETPNVGPGQARVQPE